MTHTEIEGLLGAFALDAVDADQSEVISRHLSACAQCQAEVGEHLEVAGMLTTGEAQAPPEVWDRIVGALEESPPPFDMGSLAPDRSSAGVTVLHSRRRARALRAFSATAVALAAAVIAVLGVKTVDQGHRIDHMVAASHGDQLRRAIGAALVVPNARRAALRSPDGHYSAQAVVLPDGTGYLVRDNLPQLPAGRSYQLWALVGTSKISAGLLGREARPAPFKMTGDVWGLAITDEDSAGAVTASGNPVVVGSLLSEA